MDKPKRTRLKKEETPEKEEATMTKEMKTDLSPEAAEVYYKKNSSPTKRVRKRVVIDEDIADPPNEYMEEEVTFVFHNEEQKGIPQPYSWVDKWTNIKGMMYDGQTYTMPRKVYLYLKDKCSRPKYSNVEREIVPGQIQKIATETGRIYRFSLTLVNG